MVNLFSSSLSAMNAAQTAMATTQHNIANASTPGFSRQEVTVASRPGQQTGAGFVGSGVDVAGVQRIYDQYLVNQVRLEQTQSSYLSTYHTTMTQIDNLVADPAAGASPAIQEFFSALNGVANSPESIPARQTLIGTAQFAVNRFQAIDQRLTDIANGLNGQVTASVNTVNNLAQQIAALNGNIKRAIANGQGQLPNDLMDQRDQVINQLNQEIKVSVQPQQDGALNVYVGNGQTLVINESAMRLDITRSATDPSRVDIVYRDGNITTPLQQTGLQGGNLGAFLAFRDQSLEPARNALGRVAMGLADSMNRQNRLGLDLTGAAGGDLFNVGVPRVERGVNNVGTASVSAAISDVTQLTTSDYQLRYDGANYLMVRLSDSATTNVGTTALPPANVAVDGFTISLAGGLPQKGDTYLIRPTADGARDIRVAITNPTGIAAAVPIRTVANIANTGTATIGNVTVDGTFSAANFTPASTLVYDTASNTLSGFPALPVTVTAANGTATTFAAGAPVTYTDGATYSVGGLSFTMTGAPSSGGFVGGSNSATVSATDFSVTGVPLTSGSVSFTATDFNFEAPAIYIPGASGAQAVANGFDFSIPVPTSATNVGALDSVNTTGVANFLTAGAGAGAHFNVADDSGTYTVLLDGADYASDDAGFTQMAADISSQLALAGSNTVATWVSDTANTSGHFVFSSGEAGAAAIAPTLSNIGATLAGLGLVDGAATPGVDATAGSLTIDGVTINLSGNYIDREAMRADLQILMQGSALGAGYTAAIVGTDIVISNATGGTSTAAVQIQAVTGGAVGAGFSVDTIGVTGTAVAVGSDPSTLTIGGNAVNLNQNYLSFDNMRVAIQAQLGAGFAVTNTAGAFTITRVDAGGVASVAINITGDAASDTAGITAAGVATGIPGTDLTASTIANFTVGATNVTLNQAYADRTAVRDALQSQLAGYVVTDTGTGYTFTNLTNTAAVAITNADAGAVAAGFVNSAGTVGQTNANPGDQFTLALNTNATGDNRNALLMAGMQNQNIMANGTATFQGVYGQLVGEVGAKTHELFVTSQAQINMTAQTVAAQQSVSGVNLDEEAANLMRYQRAYQAAAKAMQVANTMFDALLAIGG